MSWSQGRKGQCLYNKKWEREPQYKGWASLEEIDKIKKKKRSGWTLINLCLKAESTGKLTFVTQANSLRKTAKDKIRELTVLDVSLNSKLEKLKE